MTNTTIADTPDEDLTEVLKGLKQSQLDKLAREFNKSKSTRTRDKEQKDFRIQLAHSRMIAIDSTRIYEANRKGPHHFDDFEDFKKHDAQALADAHEQAVAIHKERIDG
jgi:histone acetyltransferase (RNA polymerase elongator complex component)|tara:strand:+ start:342 stop:668 length:327 start_codon:yes stop_codon:yes gene_type:complete